MHFIFSPLGSAGDVYPMLGIAIELRQRGHEITFLVNGYFRELVERHGLPWVELGTREEFLAAVNHPDLWKPLRSFNYLFHRGIEPFFGKQYAAVAEHAKSAGSVVIASCLGFGARIAQEKLNLPLVTLHLQPAVLWSDVEPPVFPILAGPRWLKGVLYRLGEWLVIDRTACPCVNRFREELGLPPMRRTTRWWHSPQCVVCLFPPWFAPPQPDWPANLVQADFPLWEERDDASLSPEVEAFLQAGTRPVVFTPGSANVFAGDFFRAAVEACHELGERGILLTRFAEQVPTDLPAGVRHFPYVPLSQLLPRCAALVHHGGIGTMSQALAAGVPQLLMPLAYDQLDNASRVRRLGVGDWLRPSRFRGPAVAARLKTLLASQPVSRACRDVFEKSSQRAGIRLAAGAIESFSERVSV